MNGRAVLVCINGDAIIMFSSDDPAAYKEVTLQMPAGEYRFSVAIMDDDE